MLDDVVPLDLLKNHDADLVSALNRIMQANTAPFSVFNKKDVQFCDLMQTMDSVYSNLHKQRIGAQHKHVSISTHEHKAMLWEQESLEIHHIECYNI